MSYLDEITEEVQTRPIPWEGYVRGGNLTNEQAGAFKPVDRPGPARKEAVRKSPELYADVVYSILANCSQDDVIKFALLFSSDVISVEAFEAALAKNDKLWPAFSTLLKHQDEQIRLLSANLLTEIAHKTLIGPEVVAKLFDALAVLLTSSACQDVAVEWIATLLQTKQYRSEFWTLQAKVLPAIVKVIKPSSAQGTLQSQYYALLSLWLLSFDKEIATPLVTNYETIETVLQAAKSAVKEKIARVAVATLLNLVNNAPAAAAAIIAHRGLPTVNALAERKWTDEELRADIVTLKDLLTASFENMSTFDVYLSELNSKHLQWSPPHRSTSFWKANIGEFTAADYKNLRKLVRILLETESPLIEAVACNDIAFIVGEDPEATSVLTEEDVKQHIMGLMESSDPEVRYEALRATQAFISKLFKA